MNNNVVKGATILFLVIVAGVFVLFISMHNRNEAQNVEKGEKNAEPRVASPADVESMEAKTDIAADTGVPTLVIAGSVRCDGLWLGVTVFPRGSAEPAKDLRSLALPLEKGAFHETVNLDKKYAGGGYAVAIWREKVEKNACKRGGGLPCQWCNTNGFHMDGMLASRDGKIGGGPSVSLDIKIEKDPDTEEPLSFEAAGQLDGVESDCWLGVSLYPKDCLDLVKGATHDAKAVQKGKFSSALGLGEKYAGGWYEVAIWERKVSAADCKLPYCWSCKTWGYHLEGLLAYKADSIKDIQRAKLVAVVKSLSETDSKENLCTLEIDAKILLKNVKGYLGYSIYPRGYTGLPDDAIHHLEPEGAAAFAISVKVSAKMSYGTYEVALWRTRVEKKDCKRELCESCKIAGYHVEGRLALERGALPR